jgi:hypothetical protein
LQLKLEIDDNGIVNGALLIGSEISHHRATNNAISHIQRGSCGQLHSTAHCQSDASFGMHRRVITSAITSTLLQPIAAIIRLTILLITLLNDGDLTKGAARSLWRQRPVGGGEADFGLCLLVGQLVYVSVSSFQDG